MHNYRYDLPRSGTGYPKAEQNNPYQPDTIYCVSSKEVLSDEHLKHVHQFLEKKHNVRLAFNGITNGSYLFEEIV